MQLPPINERLSMLEKALRNRAPATYARLAADPDQLKKALMRRLEDWEAAYRWAVAQGQPAADGAADPVAATALLHQTAWEQATALALELPADPTTDSPAS
jgi:hypothetical protein